MKTMRKRIACLLAFILVLEIMPVPTNDRSNITLPNIPITEAATEGTLVRQGTISNTNISWKITVDNTDDWDLTQTPYKLEITGSGDIPNYTNVGYAPWYSYIGYIKTLSIGEGITSLGQRAFGHFSSLKSVTLPDSVTYIERAAFEGCSTLETLVCGSGLKEIRTSAFSACPSLKNITLNEGLETIQAGAFYSCDVEEIDLPESLTYLGKSAFSNTPLTSLHIPANVETIEGNPVSITRNLTGITVSEENSRFAILNDILYEMDNTTPYRAIALPSKCSKYTLDIPDGTQIIADGAFYECSISTLNFPDTLKIIGSTAFTNTYISELTIPDSVESLGSSCFGTCYSLRTVSIGKGLKTWDAPFTNSNKLATITISEENPYFDSIENVVYDEAHKILYYYAVLKTETAYHVLDTVETIAFGGFYSVSKLEELYLPETLTTLESQSIVLNKSLDSIMFAGNAPTWSTTGCISSNASNLLLYKVKNSTGWDAQIGDKSVWDSFTILIWWPDNLLVEEGSIETVNWKYEAAIGRLTLSGSGAVPNYTTDEIIPWEPYMTNIQTIDAKDGITGIGNYAFTNAEMLVRFQSEETFSHIGDYTFQNATLLKFIQINTVKTIGNGAFFGDSSIIDKIYFYHLEEIGDEAFKGCSQIPFVTFGAKLQTLSQEAFADCAGMNTCILPETVTTLKTGAFSGCTALRSINIPATVTTIESDVFANDSNLQKVYFYGKIPTNWASDSFSNNNESLTLYYRKAQTDWETLSGVWNEIPVVGLDKFYTETKDHYSFTNTAASFGYSNTYRIPRQRYVDILDIRKGSYCYSLEKKWKGSCFGMTSSTLEFYENSEFDVKTYDADAESVFDIAAPANPNADLTKMIETYQISQHLPAISSVEGEVGNNYKNYSALIQRIEEFERSGGMSVDSEADPIVMTIYSLFGGHAVIPVSVEQMQQGHYAVQIYDPNFPQAFQTLYISNDLTQIGYLWYTEASYIEYSVLRDSIEAVELDMTAQDESLYAAVNKINGTVQTGDGKELNDIKGAYEQKPLDGGDTEAEFSGFRRYVLPKGTYQIGVTEENTETTSLAETNTQDTTFYLASDEIYAEVVSNDTEAVLEVQDPEGDDDTVVLSVLSEKTEPQTTYKLMNELGMERTIEISGGTADITVSKENGIQVQSEEENPITISVDGNTIDTTESSTIAFETSENENPWKIEDVSTENITLDTESYLSGSATATIILNSTEEQQGFVTAVFCDKNENIVATYNAPSQTFTTGMNPVTLNFDKLATEFSQQSGNVTLTCKISISDDAGNTSSGTAENIVVTLPEKTPAATPITTPLPTVQPSATPVTTIQPSATPVTTIQPSATPVLTPLPTATPITGAVPTQSPSEGNVTLPSVPGIGNIVLEAIKLQVLPSKLTLGKGESYQLKPLFIPANAKEALTYKSSNTKVKVNASGKITAKKVGKAVITIESESGKSATVKVTVKKAPKKVSLNAKKKKLKVGKTFNIKAKLPKNTASHCITYHSSKKSVAKVSSDGKVTALKKGKTTITVKTFNKKKARLKIVVK